MKRATSRLDVRDEDWPDEVFLLPYVGDLYVSESNRPRLLLLGESHYCSRTLRNLGLSNADIQGNLLGVKSGPINGGAEWYARTTPRNLDRERCNDLSPADDQPATTTFRSGHCTAPATPLCGVMRAFLSRQRSPAQ